MCGVFARVIITSGDKIMDNKKVSVVICCAGMGTRLGIGSTKALVDVEGKPLIIRQLELLDDYDDIRIVIGYQAERVIDVVKSYRSDIMFAFNYQYETTGVADSFVKGCMGAREYVVVIDGDVLVKPSDFERFMKYDGECICCSYGNSSTSPIYVDVNDKKQVVKFQKDNGTLDWCGIAKIKTERLRYGKKYVYQLLSELLPMDSCLVKAKDIDTPSDYENALKWLAAGYVDE